MAVSPNAYGDMATHLEDYCDNELKGCMTVQPLNSSFNVVFPRNVDNIPEEVIKILKDKYIKAGWRYVTYTHNGFSGRCMLTFTRA